MDIVTQYQMTAKEFANENDVISQHIINIITSVMMTRDGHLQGGDFVQAVVNNDLFKAINLADVECYYHLKLIVSANQYAYLN
jgi:hypothetical protein